MSKPQKSKLTLISELIGVPEPYLDTKPPTEIIPGFLWLGSQYNAADIESLKALGCKAILNCAWECPDLWLKEPHNIEYLHMHWFDNDKQKLELKTCVDWLRKQEKAGNRVLVHCQSGISRSPTVVCAYLVAEKHMDAQSALNSVKKLRPLIKPTINFRQQLFQYEASLAVVK